MKVYLESHVDDGTHTCFWFGWHAHASYFYVLLKNAHEGKLPV